MEVVVVPALATSPKLHLEVHLPVLASFAGWGFSEGQPETRLLGGVMTLSLRKHLSAFGLFACALVLGGTARAECGRVQGARALPAAMHLQIAAPHFLRAGFQRDDPDADSSAIVGFWHVKFVSEGSKGIPDGTEVDAGYAQWHSDGTEIMNSGGRSPITNAFCLGVWQSIGPRQFQLNHFAAAYDSTGTKLIGPANIRETVTVGPRGRRFEGTFTIDQYDETGASLGHVQGKITGTRIEVDTLPSSIF